MKLSICVVPACLCYHNYADRGRVVIKNERYDDWKSTLMKMKQLFINYETKVLRVEERALDPTIPRAYNSSAAQGNYLEVINMSLNGETEARADRGWGYIICMTPWLNLIVIHSLVSILLCMSKYRL